MNWTRAELKTRAKAVLKRKYWMMFVVSLILVFVAGNSGAGGSLSYNFSNILNFMDSDDSSDNYDYGDYEDFGDYDDYEYYDEFEDYEYYEDFENYDGYENYDSYNASDSYVDETIISIIFLVVFITIIAALLIRVLAGYNLSIGCLRYFIGTAQGQDMQFGVLGSTFKKGIYFNVIQTLLLRDVFLFLWSLVAIVPATVVMVLGILSDNAGFVFLGILFFIPGAIVGAVKLLSYIMTPYLLADNPQLSPTRAITLSKAMTQGEKWEIYVLGLSFIGWSLLGVLACCIGTYFLQPYIEATYAELYLVLREKALVNGYTTAEELNLATEPVESALESFGGQGQNNTAI
jgi:uncharacterized membrane protein